MLKFNKFFLDFLLPPQDLGYSIEMKQNSVNELSYPNEKYWKNN